MPQGYAVPKSHIARNITQAVNFAEGIGYPVVMKIVSRPRCYFFIL